MSIFRISGLASGLDTDSIITQLMSIERQPETLMQQNKQKLSWVKGYWSDINTKLLAIKTSVGSLLDRNQLLLKKATSTDDSIVSASADANAASGTYTINVTRLASETELRSGKGALNLGLGGTIAVDQAFNSATSNFGSKVTSGYFTINGVKITIADGDYLGTGNTSDPKDLLGKINSSGAGVVASYDAMTDKITITSSAAGGNLNLGSVGDTSNFLTATGLLAATRTADSKVSTFHLGRINPDQDMNLANFQTAVTDDGTGNGAFKINGVEITYDVAKDSLNQVLTRINNSSANVSATYDSMTDSLVIRSKETGSVSILLEEEAGKGNFLSAFNLTQATGGVQTLGDNASFTVSGFNNDQPITSTSNSVKDIIPGVTLNLKAKTDGPETITIAQDVTASAKVVQDFVAKVNDAMSYLNQKLSEKRVFGKEWDSMTDAERQSGLMRGDSTLTGIRTQLMSIATDRVDGMPADMDSLSDIGITTKVDLSSAGGTGGSTLQIDEAKLEAALRDRPDMVMKLLFNDANENGKWDADDTTGKPTESGVAVRLDYYLQTLTDTRTQLFGGVSAKMGSVPRQQDVLTSEMDDIQKSIDAFEARMTMREENLRRQFTAMETAISQSQTTSSWLTSQIAKLS